MQIINDLLVEIIILCTAITSILLSLIIKNNNKIQIIERTTMLIIALSIAILALYTKNNIVTKLYKIDNITIFTKSFILIMILFSYMLPNWSWFSIGSSCRLSNNFIILIATLGMMIIAMSRDLVLLYFGIEILSICTYILIAIDKKNELSINASIQYFISSALFSGIYLYGLSLIYISTNGSTAIPLISSKLAFNEQLDKIAMFGLLMISAGLLFKLGCAPFHMWAPEVYPNSPMATTLIMMTASKICIIPPLFKLTTMFSQNAIIFAKFFQTVGIFSLILGMFCAIRQLNIKKLLAFSSISNVGYIVIILSFFIKNPESIEFSYQKIATTYMIVYSFFLIGMFSLISMANNNNKECMDYDIRKLSIITKNNPLIATGSLIILLSSMSIPPFAGFFTKLYTICAAMFSSVVAIIAISIATIISTYYYIKIITSIYFIEKDINNNSTLNLESFALKAMLFLSAAFSICFILFGNFFFK